VAINNHLICENSWVDLIEKWFEPIVIKAPNLWQSLILLSLCELFYYFLHQDKILSIYFMQVALCVKGIDPHSFK